MPWITVEEPYAKPPKVASIGQRPEWSAPLTIDRGWAEFDEVAVPSTSEPDFDGCDELTVRESSVSGLAFGGEQHDLAIEVQRSQLEGCDLSGQSIRTIRGSRVTACKMIGTDFSAGTIADTVFEHCILRYTNLRMAKLSRVEFIDCTFDDVDCYQMEAEDVTFPGSTLSAVSLDSLTATRFDLREASEITLSAITRLDGCLVSEHQLAGLAHSLAMAAGIQVEQIDDEEPGH